MYNTQQQTVLRLLQEAGTLGVNSYALTYVHGIKQAPTRIKELRDQGYNIESNTQLNRSVTYVLLDRLHVPQVTTQAKSKPKKEYFTWKVEDMEYDKATNTFRYKT